MTAAGSFDAYKSRGLKMCRAAHCKCIVIFTNKWYVLSISTVSLKNRPTFGRAQICVRLHFNAIHKSNDDDGDDDADFEGGVVHKVNSVQATRHFKYYRLVGWAWTRVQNELNARCQNVSFLFIIISTDARLFFTYCTHSLVRSIVRLAFGCVRIVCIFWRCYFNFSGLMLIPMCCVTYQKSILEPWTPTRHRVRATEWVTNANAQFCVLSDCYCVTFGIPNNVWMSNLIANSAQNQLLCRSLNREHTR